MIDQYDKIQEATEFIKSRIFTIPDIAVILGTGLTGFDTILKNKVTIPYNKIPHFKNSTVPSHINELNIGQIGNKTVITFAGRLHLYEGHSLDDVTFPIRIIQAMGAKMLIMSNASGGINTDYTSGDIVFLKDHINFMGDNPLKGFHDPRFGARFPDMMEAYSQSLLSVAKTVCLKNDYAYKEGIYLGLQGPSLETPAEYRAFKMWGADMIGMSTIPEVIVAKQSKLHTLVMSIITNVFDDEKREETTLDSVIEVAKKAESKCVHLLSEIITHI